MEENYNGDIKSAKDPVTSSTDSKSNSKTTGDSQVQDGQGVGSHEIKSYDKSEDQQEYIDNVNVKTKQANVNPDQGEKGLSG